MCLKVQNDKKTNQSHVCPTHFDHCRDLFRGELSINQCRMFCVANISVMFTHSLPKGAFSFSHILLATFCACKDIHKVVAFARYTQGCCF